MKTSQGKLAVLAFVLLLAAVLLMPMEAGYRDELLLSPQVLKMSSGGSYTIKCRLSAENLDQRIAFSSSDENVAVVASDGTVYALDSGTAVVTATASGGARAEMRVQVEGVALSELKLNATELHIAKGEFTGLRADYNEDATDRRLQWISSDENVARVDSSGRITGVGGGEAYVSVVAPNGRYATAKVCVDVPAEALRITPNMLTVGVGASVPLQASYLPEDCTDRVYRWISSDPQVLSVSENGVITALRPGTAHVSALTVNGLTAGMEVIVESAPEEIRINPSAAVIDRGDVLDLELILLQEDGKVDSATTHPVEWRSDNSEVATVDENGVVTGHKTGACRISASIDGKTASCQLKVEVNVREIVFAETEKYLLREETDTPIFLNWTVVPADADDPAVMFTTNNEQVAVVDSDGVVTLTGGYGTAVIRAMAKSGVQATYTVNVVTALPPSPVETSAADDFYGDVPDAEEVGLDEASENSLAVGIIGGADGPTSIFIADSAEKSVG